MLRKAVILLLAAAQILMPVLLQPKENLEQIAKQAEMDAEEDINTREWQATGFLMMPIGIISAKMYSPPIPSSRIVGKSSRYLKAYAKSYKKKTKEIQTKYAKMGCFTGVIFWPSVIFTAIQLGILSKERFM